VAIEILTHHGGDAPDLLMDAGITRVFDRVTDFPRWTGIPA
jgi:hypothetical protein